MMMAIMKLAVLIWKEVHMVGYNISVALSHVPTRVSVAVMCLIFCFCFGIFIYLFSVAFLLLFNVMYTNMDEYTRPEKISCYRNPRMTRGARLSTCQALIASCIVGPASPPIRA